MSLSCRRSREDVSTHPPAGVRGLHEAVTGVSPTCCPGGLSHTTLSQGSDLGGNRSSWGARGGSSAPRTGQEVRSLQLLGSCSWVIPGPQPRHDLLQTWPWG